MRKKKRKTVKTLKREKEKRQGKPNPREVSSKNSCVCAWIQKTKRLKTTEHDKRYGRGLKTTLTKF